MNEQTMIMQAERVKDLLVYCAHNPGAKINISVVHDDGRTATAELYDLAALVEALYDALTYFQSELS